MGSYKDLDVWKISMQLVKEVYLVSKQFPKEEIFGLTSQCRRAAVSITANIAEGLGRQYKKDTIQFLHISRGSLYEVDALLNVALNIEIINEEDFNKISPTIEKCLRLLNGFINYNQKAELK
jgi:four helix bundle protein